jgi:hypothetical protein
MDSFLKFCSKILMKKIKITFNEYNFGIDDKLLKSENDLFNEIDNFILLN